jgi:phospholysine phosphohistidine inorganic pyrophosphate phosphatase
LPADRQTGALVRLKVKLSASPSCGARFVDRISLDVAPFVAALEHATGRNAAVFGKPAEAFFHAGAERLALPPDQVLMIGDDVQTDVGGAQAAVLKAALVKTGKFRPADLDGAVKPFAVLDSVASLPAKWETMEL